MVNVIGIDRGAKLRLRRFHQTAAANAQRKRLSDDDAAGDLAAGLIRVAGFDPVPVGGLDQSIRIEMFGDLHEYGALGRVVTKTEALAAI